MSSRSHIDPPTYTWIQTSPSTWRRPALAGEAPWISRPKTHHELFLYAFLALRTPTLTRTLHRAAALAWRRLRFEVPELDCSAAYEADGFPHLTYHVPQIPGDEQDVAWTGMTPIYGVMCRTGFEGLRGMLLDFKTGLGKEDEMGDLGVNLLVGGAGELVSNVEVLLNVDHRVMDGVGVRILLGQFLEIFAGYLGRGGEFGDEELSWGDSSRNLSPAWIQQMNGEQMLSGAEYETVVARNRDLVFNKLAQNPGLPLLQAGHPPTQQTHFITLTESQSTLLVQQTRLLFPKANITHLGHAAMVLATLRSAPPSASASTSSPRARDWHSPCWLNGRRYLQPSAQRYIPICQSVAPIVFYDVEELVLKNGAKNGATNEVIRERLVRACRMATEGYGQLRGRKSVLPEAVLLMEDIGRGLWRKEQEALAMAGKIPDKELKEGTQPLTADPFFLSDGITEQYVAHSYPTNPSKSKAFDVNDVTFAAHAEKNLIIRMSSWRGRTTLSAEWVACDFDHDIAVKLLEDVVEIMLCILNEKEAFIKE